MDILTKPNKNKKIMKAILIMMTMVGLRLIYAVLFEYPSLFMGLIGVGLTVFCVVALIQEFRDGKNNNKKD